MSSLFDYLKNVSTSSVPEPPVLPDAAYLFQYANLEDYKMRDRPYTYGVYTDVDKLLKNIRKEIAEFKEDSAGDYLIGWTFSTDEETVKKVQALDIGDFDYIAYSKDCTQAFWISKCQLNE